MEDLKYSAPEEGGEGDEIVMTQAEQDASWDSMMAEQRSRQYAGIKEEVPDALSPYAHIKSEVPSMLDRGTKPTVSEPVELPTDVVKPNYIQRLQLRIGVKPDSIWGPQSSKALVSHMEEDGWNPTTLTAEKVIDDLVDASVPSKVPKLLLSPDMSQAGGAVATTTATAEEAASISFNNVLEDVLDNEGGYRTEEEATAANDSGGATNYGVAYNYHKEYLKDNFGVEKASDMENLTEEQASTFYKEKFYDKYKIGEFPEGSRSSVFDVAVNSGANGIKTVAIAVGLEQTATIDDIVSAAQNNPPDEKSIGTAQLERLLQNAEAFAEDVNSTGSNVFYSEDSPHKTTSDSNGIGNRYVEGNPFGANKIDLRNKTQAEVRELLADYL
jgi:hypothetical protein